MTFGRPHFKIPWVPAGIDEVRKISYLQFCVLAIMVCGGYLAPLVISDFTRDLSCLKHNRMSQIEVYLK